MQATALNWVGIMLCLMHSALFSGLNLGFFGLSRLRLEIQAETKDPDAMRILSLRKDAHFLLSTVLWGNVASNVLLTLLSESIVAGLGAFLLSTCAITFFGEILPQAYLAKHALRYSSVLVPIVRIYQLIFYPVAKPTAFLLDRLLGREQVNYFKEAEIMVMLSRQATSGVSDLEKLESMGAINFLRIDDVSINKEGEVINPKSIISLPCTKKGIPIFPKFEKDFNDPFLNKVHASEEKWVIITDKSENPVLVLDADRFLRDVMYGLEVKSVYTYCHRPIVVTNSRARLGDVLQKFKVRAHDAEDDVVDNDIILYWSKERRIITGADILGRLLRGIVKRIDK